MRWEQVPEIPLFSDNTAAFVHDLPTEAISNAAGASNYIRVQVLTPIGVLDRDKQLGVVKELTEIVTTAAGDPSYAERTWVLNHRVARRWMGHRRPREHRRRHRRIRPSRACRTLTAKDVVIGFDGEPRCSWAGDGDTVLGRYHDAVWGRRRRRRDLVQHP